MSNGKLLYDFGRATTQGVATRDNRQLETQLLAEWASTLPRGWLNKTHVNVGRVALDYNGARLTPARARAFGVWNDWADMRIFTGAEVWIVEAKIVSVAAAYGQVLDYLDEYPYSEDYRNFAPAPVAGVVLAAFGRPRTTALFSRYGIRTVIYTPTWAADSLEAKIFNSPRLD